MLSDKASWLGEQNIREMLFPRLRSFVEKHETMHTREEKMQAFGRILDVLDELREKCPWDRKQTNESLRP